SPSDAKAHPHCTVHTMSDITPPIDGLSLLSGPDQPDLNRGEVLADLFAATARRLPDQTALLHDGRRLSYGELDELAERVAARLSDTGVGPGQIVGLWLPRGIDLLVMQLGIAKSGAAWLPFDAETPVDRIKVCLADAGAAGLLSCAAQAGQLADLADPLWTAEALLLPLAGARPSRPAAAPSDPAYVIYTSGSTGRPKGIQITQGAI